MTHSHRVQTNLGELEATCIDTICPQNDPYIYPWQFRTMTKLTGHTVIVITYEGDYSFELASSLDMPDTERAAIVCNALNRDSIEQVRLAESI